jgi:transposase
MSPENKQALDQETKRVEVVRRHRAGERQRDLAWEYGVSQSTVSRWVAIANK